MAQLFHIGLTGKNLERSLAFYRDVAEMTEGEHLEVRSTAFDTLTNNPGTALKVAHLTAGTFILQLIEYAAAGGSILDLHHNHVGSPHMSFFVPDVEQIQRGPTQRRGQREPRIRFLRQSGSIFQIK